MLFLEFKKESPFLKNGNLSTNKHIQEQNEIHKSLRKKGYKGKFIIPLPEPKVI